MSDTDWIVPGAEVVIYMPGTPETQPRGGHVATVGDAAFTVTGQTPAFFIDSGRQVTSGSRSAVAMDSDEGRAVLKRWDLRRDTLIAEYNAARAVAAWQFDRTRTNRLAAIDALWAIDDEEQER